MGRVHAASLALPRSYMEAVAWLPKRPSGAVHNVGAGGGVVSHVIARRTDVKRIHVSDTGKEHLAFAAKMLRAHHGKIDFILRITIAEETLLDDS